MTRPQSTSWQGCALRLRLRVQSAVLHHSMEAHHASGFRESMIYSLPAGTQCYPAWPEYDKLLCSFHCANVVSTLQTHTVYACMECFKPSRIQAPGMTCQKLQTRSKVIVARGCPHMTWCIDLKSGHGLVDMSEKFLRFACGSPILKKWVGHTNVGLPNEATDWSDTKIREKTCCAS